MGIYRGPGGPGDATSDTANSSIIAVTAANAALLSELAAANNATLAENAADAAAISETSASTSASTATTQATNASNSASAASTSASQALSSKNAAQTAQGLAETASDDATASAQLAQDWATKTSGPVAGGEYSSKYNAQQAATSAGSAASSATSANNAKTAAETARDQTLAAFDNFDDRYLGTKSSDPTLDNDGNALIAGALYFNSVSGTMKVYDGTNWLAAYASLSGALLATNNLSDISSAASARTNLGLGTAATTAATAYATAAQGTKADTAYGWGNHASAGYLTTESDPVYLASSWYSTTNNANNWNTAYSWGNHASAGYLTSLGIGTLTQAYDSNLTSFVNTFTLTTTDGTANQVMKTDGAGNITFGLVSAGDAYVGSSNTFTANQVISVTDNTNPALRVTQLGSGDALRVEDSTNPDSTPFIIKNDGKVGIGTDAPSYELEVQSTEPTARVYATNASLASMVQIANPSNAMMIGKDRNGSSGWYGSAGEYVVAGNGAFPLNVWVNSSKRISFEGDSVGRTNVIKPAYSSRVSQNTGAVDLSLSNNFTVSPTGPITLSFTNTFDGQTGVIVLANTSGYAISKSNVYADASFLTTVSSPGVYLISYFSISGSVRLTYSQNTQV